MDPVTHSLTGAALSGAGLRRSAPLATATLVIAANAPDIDILSYMDGEYAALAFRRGWTHGPLGWILLPVLVTAVMLAVDRIRRGRAPGAAPARPRTLLGLAALGVATHPLLDFLNIYGIRLLMPVSERWYYGDILFIVDPWVWLMLGGAGLLAFSRSRSALLGWGLGILAAATIMAAVPSVPPAAKLSWLAGLLALIAVRALRPSGEPAESVRAVRVALALAVAYLVIMTGSNHGAERLARAELTAAGMDVEEVMMAPAPANPLAGDLVAVTDRSYHRGSFHWLRRDRVRLRPAALDRLRPGSVTDPAITAALEDPRARDFLTWSRFPFVRVRPGPDAHIVEIGDARYSETPGAGGLAGVRVRVDRGY